MEVASQIGLKAQKKCIKTLVVGINSLKTRHICFFFFYNSRGRTWQQLLVSSQPILDFLQPCSQDFSITDKDSLKALHGPLKM